MTPFPTRAEERRGVTAVWIRKARTDDRRREAIAQLELAIVCLSSCSDELSATVWADELAAAAAHVDQASDAINESFEGIGS